MDLPAAVSSSLWKTFSNLAASAVSLIIILHPVAKSKVASSIRYSAELLVVGQDAILSTFCPRTLRYTQLPLRNPIFYDRRVEAEQSAAVLSLIHQLEALEL